MGAMTLGTLIAGRLLESVRDAAKPYLVYALLELAIGLCGTFVEQELALVARIDAAHPSAFAQLAGIALTVGPPAMAMGASIPVLGLVAATIDAPLGILYGLNTLGAAAGILLTAFVVLPLTGIADAGRLLAATNGTVALVMLGVWRKRRRATTGALPPLRMAESTSSARSDYLVAFSSGAAIFALEVAWFRAMRAAYLSTAFSFAVMLAAVLLGLAVGAHVATPVKRSNLHIGSLMGAAGAMVVLVTPLVERLDVFSSFVAINHYLSAFLLAVALLGPIVATLGVLFPLLLEQRVRPREWGLLHATNSVGAIAGALVTAWLLLPNLGFAHTTWLIAALLLVEGVLLEHGRRPRTRLAAAGAIALAIAAINQSGIGTRRIMGPVHDHKVIAFAEAPDFTVAVVDSRATGVDERALYVDGFSASTAASLKGYMAWMGRLPMIAHPDPREALVICFGTGETSNAVRLENPRHLDIVDISKTVFEMAPFFPMNGGVLSDPRVTPIVMDGRAWLRRSSKRYDVITLEPMPPTFSGMNSLYSREFYRSARERLNDGGTIAQWLPLHLLAPEQSAAITRTFVEVFPQSLLWIYPPYRTAILVGRKGDAPAIDWPGLDRQASGRELDGRAVESSVQLRGASLARYARSGTIITDDNQYLAYGWASERNDFGSAFSVQWEKESFDQIRGAK
jgi:spermidine synthase